MGVFSPGLHLFEDSLADALIENGEAELAEVEPAPKPAPEKKEAPPAEEPPQQESATEPSESRSKANPFKPGKGKK